MNTKTTKAELAKQLVEAEGKLNTEIAKGKDLERTVAHTQLKLIEANIMVLQYQHAEISNRINTPA